MDIFSNLALGFATTLQPTTFARLRRSFAPERSTGTEAFAINNKGGVTGIYYDDTRAGHGFVRAANGTPRLPMTASCSTPAIASGAARY